MSTPLFSCLYGSKLFGTSTPTSDRDVKYVVLPDLNDLLLGHKLKNQVKKTNTSGQRNVSTDVDEEFIPLQQFARDFVSGQTYALELAWAVDGDEAEQTFYDANFAQRHDTLFYKFVKELRSKFLTSEIKAMVSYVLNQTNLYSMKGERLNVVLDVLEALLSIKNVETAPPDEKLGDVADQLVFEELAAKHPKYFARTEYDVGSYPGEKLAPCFKVLDRTLPFTTTVSHARSVMKNVEKKYGARAAAAACTGNVDWKAMMHAVRIAQEAVRLMRKRKLSFPLSPEEVDYLLSVKRGEVPLATVTQQLSELLSELEELSQTSSLPSSNVALHEELNVWMVSWLRKFYSL